MAHPMDRYFAPEEGRIFACFPGAEDRPGQRRMAELVFNAVADGGARFDQWRNRGAEPESKPEAVIQAVEAGTGTGKSLGYLIPALSAGRHPVLVATRTKQLQRQLLEEDVPRASGILGRSIKAVLAKGRANYLCRTAWEAVSSDPHLEFSRSDQQLWLALQRWTRETQDGDREGLGRFGEGESPLWDKINARAERCTGRQCPRFEDCYLTKLRAEVAEADLIIVNHALLLADRVLRESAFGQVLPDAPVLILDEAHELEEQLTESCAETWSSRAMSLLFTDLREAAKGSGAGLAGLLEPWEQAWSGLMTWVPLDGGVQPLLAPGPEMKALADAVGAWVEAGHPLWVEARRLAGADPENPLWMRLAERVGTAFARMEQIFAQPEGWVSTLSREGANLVHFKSNPVDVRPFFHQHVRRGFESVVMTSATLRDGRGFNGLGLRLGLTKPEVEAAEHVESPFDFEGQGLLFVPPGLPERRPGAGGVGDPAWVEASIAAMERMLRASRGRALLLFTSRKMLAAFRPRLEAALPEITFFVQGEGLSRTQLLDRFRATPSAALLGLASFWQGVDLPGDALSLVVVSALPFAPPDDPVLQARIREADAQREGLGFIGIQVPQMTLKLKQGIGRLIRTRSDRGVVAVMDPRLMLPSEDRFGKRYAAQVRAALPPFPLTRDWERVETFLGAL
ncbi:MAG: ATP-dependent DNA helicase [Acidobacteria bacterium]|nr:ATP-dependent DNA helicase [Acidobacteriota bacterium]MBI3487182.1 ATP-dependent DNA helicase [Acidobacteriota bacterium]